ncbi:MAG: hydroxylamine reductase [Coprothermobacterota bacterium]|nr:hydroxylamine reductase [Coprothermobacterota bacterium]
MFCRQCEQTAAGKGCTIQGVCGKSPEVATLQDLLIYGMKGIAFYGRMARQLNITDPQVDRFLMEGLFTTITNVNFDADQVEGFVRRAFELKERLKERFLQAYEEHESYPYSGEAPAAARWAPAADRQGLLDQGSVVGILADPTLPEDVRSLRELLLLGLKGMAAYADHAAILGKEDEVVNAFFHKGLASLLDDALTVDDLVALNMEFGQVNLRCLQILDAVHVERFGAPVPAPVSLGARKGSAILVSGHDLLDLETLLQQTDGSGIQIYTHGEMLPAHGYPNLKKHPHLAGHYGTAWQNQQREFAEFPGAVLMTTNCIQKPREAYLGRIFTTGLAAWPGVTHIPADEAGKKDFRLVIEAALQAGGFPQDIPGKEILVGFGHDAVLGVAGQIVQAVKEGNLRHFFLIGGCDGAKLGRNYYTELAQKIPADCAILTLACGKFRFNTLDFGTIAGLPRLLDCGQCNDAYSAVVIASALADAFGCTVNDLPLSLVLSWYEQKAVCILITLLSLGIRKIRLGPTLPAFISPGVLQVLVDKFQIQPITTPEEDLQAILG